MPADLRSADAPISESDLIDLIKRRVSSKDAHLAGEIGIGDDAAVMNFDAKRIVLTVDAMVDGAHFVSGMMPWSDIGWKCIVSNQSDIAAMGAIPEHAVMTLAVPATLRMKDVEEVLSGAVSALDRYGGRLVGGDTVSSNNIMLSVSMTGRLVRDDHPLTRDSARPGQLVAVSGPLGASAGGLQLLNYEDAQCHCTVDNCVSSLIKAHYRPCPRVDLVETLVESGVGCAMDISDGLILDLGRICVASDVDAVVYDEKVPQDPALSCIFNDKAQEFALTGGEDYELLCVGDADAISRVDAVRSNKGVCGLTVVGEILPRSGARGEVSVLDASGNRMGFKSKGWEHFAD